MDYWFLRRNTFHCLASTILFLSHNDLVRCQNKWMHFVDITHTLFSWPQTKDVLHSDTGGPWYSSHHLHKSLNVFCVLLHSASRMPKNPTDFLCKQFRNMLTCFTILSISSVQTDQTYAVLHVNKAQQVKEGTYTVSVIFIHVYKHHYGDEALEAK